MTTEKENINIFNANALSTKDINGIVFTLYDNRIVHVKIPSFGKITIELTLAGNEFIEENGGGKYYNIYEFESYADVDPEVREWAADSEGNNYTHTDAIVIGNLSQKIITDFYLKFNKPARPTQIFYSLEKAVKWTQEQMEKK